MARPRVSCGLEYLHVNEISSALQESNRSGYDFVSVPLVHPRYIREHIYGKAKNRNEAFTRSDLLLTSTDWNTLVVGRLSPSSCVLCDSEIWDVRANSEATLQQELTFASHLGLPAVFISLTSSRCVNLARIAYEKAAQAVCYQIWVRVKLQAPYDLAIKYRSDMQNSERTFQTDTWIWWNRFHSLANLEKKIGLALEVTADLPEQKVLDRWLGEPIRCALLPTSIFLTNKKGFPVLTKAHQEFVKNLFRLQVQFVITGPIRHNGVKLYQQYLDHLMTVSLENDDIMRDFAKGYEDFLQCPLQPLMDNLESQTYEIFEKDPIKYVQYENAIVQALKDKVPDNLKEEKEVVLMVVGAGRGPLVRKALTAATKAQRRIRVYAVEKNPNAVVTLQSQQDECWGNLVTVVPCDMRDWEAPEKADILVSELLGSFGDNELSPECLDGAQKFLKDDGISIPSDYTSYLSPIQSPKLYSEIRQCREKDKHFLAHFEMGYVVYLQNKKELSCPQPLFSFHHPNKDDHIDNRRYKSLQFDIWEDSVVHGLAGYFEATLYKDIKLSSNPETYTKGLISWFPIHFPLKDPVPVRAGDFFEVHFWRCRNPKKVWYEWCVTSPLITPIHNPNGRAYYIGL